MAGTSNEGLSAQLKRLPAIRRDTLAEILRQLEVARRDILGRLALASIDSRPVLERQRIAIEQAIGRFASAIARTIHSGQGTAWAAGVDLVRTALGSVATGVAVNDRALLAMKAFTTDRIKDIGIQTVDRINAVLAQVVIGTKPMSQGITEIQAILGSTRKRAMSIAYTNVGAAYSEATYAKMLQDEAAGVKLAKRWLKSGKAHPRPGHVHAHNQIRRVSEPFEIVDPRTGEMEKLRFPRDPQASIGNTINCGCVMVPVVDGSSYGASVIQIPEDRSQPIRKIPRAQFEAEAQARVAQVNDRLARFLSMPASETGLQITHTGNAAALLQSREGDGVLATQIALWWSKPTGRLSAGVVPPQISRGMAARSSEVTVGLGTRNKQVRKHPDLDAAFYAGLPRFLTAYRVAVRDRGDAVLVFDLQGNRYQLVLKRWSNGNLNLSSVYRLSPAREKKLRTLPVIDGAW